MNRVDFLFLSSQSLWGDCLLNGFINDKIEIHTKCMGSTEEGGAVTCSVSV